MAKKKVESNQAPVISSIPVPPSDSALVIDLPDGQKLLVGKIEAGTVIEVATWRGTGRPDSRTNRLMLGMSNENETKQADPNPEPSPPSIRSMKFPQNFFFVISKILMKLQPIFGKLLSSIKKKEFRVVNLQKFKLKNLKLPRFIKLRNSSKSTDSISSVNLEIEEDFEADFQRILDEVSQRRSSDQGKSLERSAAMSKQAKRSGKKAAKTGKRPVKKSK